MPLHLKIVSSKKELEQFVFLPQQLHQNRKNFVPPIYADEKKFYDAAHNKSLSYCDTELVLAFQDEKCVGRIMCIIHHPHNHKNNLKQARFFNLDCVDDVAVCTALITHAEQWAKQKGMNSIIGPFGFSDKDPQGFQVEGFENLPVIAAPTNAEYLPKLIEQCGYQKEVDCVSYQLDATQPLPDVYRKISERVLNKYNLKVVEFTRRSELKPYIVPVFNLINTAYSEIFGFVAMNESEMKAMAKQYLPILNPKFVKCVVDSQNEIIAFVIANPDLSAGLQKAKGKLFPFGFIHILQSMKHATQLDLLLGAVKKEFQGKGITAPLAVTLYEAAKAYGIKTIDSHLILETNLPMRAECERLNGRLYKRYRIYFKELGL